jgi:hypothetical protein
VEPEKTTHPLGETIAGEPDVAPNEAGETGADEAAPPPPTDKPPRPPTVGQLRRDRRRLWDERQETVYHLGGLAADLHARGMIDQELIVRRARIVHELDARIALIDEELVELDTQRRGRRGRLPQPAGYCLSCGAPFLPEAAFCSQCGARIHVMEDEGRTGAIAEAGDPADYDADTQVIPPFRDRGDA